MSHGFSSLFGFCRSSPESGGPIEVTTYRSNSSLEELKSILAQQNEHHAKMQESLLSAIGGKSLLKNPPKDDDSLLHERIESMSKQLDKVAAANEIMGKLPRNGHLVSDHHAPAQTSEDSNIKILQMRMDAISKQLGSLVTAQEQWQQNASRELKKNPGNATNTPVGESAEPSLESLTQLFKRQVSFKRQISDVLQSSTPAAKVDLEPMREQDEAAQLSHRVFSWLGWSPRVNTPCYNSLHKWFPTALPGISVHERIRVALEDSDLGFTPKNTIFGTSICPDEINNQKGDMADIMKDHWGECFPLGGISGSPFVGKSGFNAFAHHVPDNGNILILFGPHVAISEAGELGQYLREGQSSHSAACGAVIGAFRKCCKCQSGCVRNEEFDEADMQMAWIAQQLEAHASHLQEQENPLAALSYQAFEMVKNLILQIVNTDFGTGYLALIGGIQINMPEGNDDHFLPLLAEVRQAGKNPFSILHTFNMEHLDQSSLKDLASAAIVGKTLVGQEDLAIGAAELEMFSWMGWAPNLNTACSSSLRSNFPGAIPGKVAHARIKAALTDAKWGFSPETTLLGVSICPDEINNEKGDLADIMQDYWGGCFPLGGISGAPFVGKTGFGAFSHHVPHGGNILILFGPHVAVAESGEVGKYLRTGQADHSTACGAVIGAYHACCNKSIVDGDFDPHDMQMGWIKKMLDPHVENIKVQPNPMTALVHQAYILVKDKLLNIVNTDFGSGYLVLVGGIQINMPSPCDDHFLPMMFEVRKEGMLPQDLMQAFELVLF